jgi:hypothetical protein
MYPPQRLGRNEPDKVPKVTVPIHVTDEGAQPQPSHIQLETKKVEDIRQPFLR